MSHSFKITVLISGGGTTLKNLIDLQNSGRLDATIVGVISSNGSATGNEFARQHNIPLSIVERAGFKGDQEFSDAIFQECRRTETELVVLGGFLKRVLIPKDFENQVINIHPSLIPQFSGKGFYGMKVHNAVVEYGCKVSGCTVHFVDNQYDHGPIIAQRSVEVASNQSAEALQKRIFAIECQLYPEVINAIARGQVHVENRYVSVYESDRKQT